MFSPPHSDYVRQGVGHPKISFNHGQQDAWSQTTKEVNYFRDKLGSDGGGLILCLGCYLGRKVFYSQNTRRS